MKIPMFLFFLSFTFATSNGQITVNANNHVAFLDIDMKLPYASVKSSLITKGFKIDKSASSPYDKTEESLVNKSLGYQIDLFTKE